MFISISIVEDDEKFAKVLKETLESEKDFVVSFIYPNAATAYKGLQENPTDIILLDIQLPDGRGSDIVSVLKPQMPNTHFIMNTSYDEDELIFESLKGGAGGYIVKTDSLDKIVGAIWDVMAGGAPMSAGIAKKVIQYFSKPVQKKQMEGLTSKEMEILEHLSKGLFYKEISAELNITLDTVKKHCGNIYRKLEVSNRTEAINLYLGR